MELTWGSCYGLKDKKNDLFFKVGNPDLFIWGGDVAYTDSIHGAIRSQFMGGEHGESIDHIRE